MIFHSYVAVYPLGYVSPIETGCALPPPWGRPRVAGWDCPLVGDLSRFQMGKPSSVAPKPPVSPMIHPINPPLNHH